ncbi:hypothetical protein LR48_Vigan11g151400 [Vigna angularis]|uniref:Uncharacterized protein n=1 Tax=Phaseolus angularis TaxID=3914 RepID=A0A0L9VTU3_PHAAN|nr:hypothetical protein LR48_Vigan11g151400 [Vigna angularis]
MCMGGYVYLVSSLNPPKSKKAPRLKLGEWKRDFGEQPSSSVSLSSNRPVLRNSSRKQQNNEFDICYGVVIALD